MGGHIAHASGHLSVDQPLYLPLYTWPYYTLVLFIIDLTSGFWQIPVDPTSIEKTVFTIVQVLGHAIWTDKHYCSLPATHAAWLNPESGKEFVSDDILIFSPTLEEHLDNRKKVMDRLGKASLKLKPLKCMFIREEVEHLGHALTKQGQKQCRSSLSQLKYIHDVWRFLGLSSSYQRFIPGLLSLYTDWQQRECLLCGQQCVKPAVCEAVLRTCTILPLLDRDFTQEMDALIQRLGAVLLQKQGDGKLHLVA